MRFLFWLAEVTIGLFFVIGWRTILMCGVIFAAFYCCAGCSGDSEPGHPVTTIGGSGGQPIIETGGNPATSGDGGMITNEGGKSSSGGAGEFSEAGEGGLGSTDTGGESGSAGDGGDTTQAGSSGQAGSAGAEPSGPYLGSPCESVTECQDCEPGEVCAPKFDHCAGMTSSNIQAHCVLFCDDAKGEIVSELHKRCADLGGLCWSDFGRWMCSPKSLVCSHHGDWTECQ